MDQPRPGTLPRPCSGQRSPHKRTNTGRLRSSAPPACPTTPTPSVATTNSDRELVACTPKGPSLTGTATLDKPHPPKSGAVRSPPSHSANQPPDHRGEKPRLTCGESTVLRFPPTMRTRGTEWPRVDRLLERVRHTCASSIEHDPNQLQKPRRALRWPKPQRATPAHHHQRSRGSGASSPGREPSQVRATTRNHIRGMLDRVMPATVARNVRSNRAS
jgi:hypothetical protein